MSKSFSRPGALFFPGCFFSLLWHAAWFGCVVPAARPLPSVSPSRTQIIFLGAILGERDFDTASPSVETSRFTVSDTKDYSRAAFFVRVAVEAEKPNGAVRGALRGVRQAAIAPSQAPSARQTAPPEEEIIFTLQNYSFYFDRLTFSDIKGLFDQQELGGYLEFRARVALGGRMECLEKVAGSGNPVLDFYIIRKMKNALLRRPTAPGARLKLRLRLMQRDDAAD